MSKEKKKRIKRYPWKCSICSRIYESLDTPPVFEDISYNSTVRICIYCDKNIKKEYFGYE